MSKKDTQRIVLITGASSGIGQACAVHLHQRGYRVYGTSRHAAGQAPSPSGSFEMIQMDVDVDHSVQRGVEYILERQGRLDVVVNNAGFGLAGAIEDTSIGEAKSQFETNFFGVLRVCQAALPIMREQRAGHLVTIGSLAGRVGLPFQAFYSASKFALLGLSEALRLEVRPFGIQVALIEPGDFCTGFTAHRRRTAQSQENPVYLERCNASVGVMEADERQGSDPVKIAHLLTKIIENPSPRLRYTAGPAFQRIVVVALKKIVPARLFEWGLSKYYKLS